MEGKKMKSICTRILLLAAGLVLLPTLAMATHISSTLDATAPVTPLGVASATTGLMPARLYRSGDVPGTCDAPKPVPTEPNMLGNFRYDTYTITPTVTGCVTISYHFYAGTSYTGVYQVSVYSDFIPTDPKANFIADSNTSTTLSNPREFVSFMATAGVPYTIVVWHPYEGYEAHYLLELNDSLARPADYDGDGYTDTAVFRPSTADWFILYSATNTTGIVHFGMTGDVPVDGDFDGDGVSDLAIFRPSVGQWWIQRSINGTTFAAQFGQAGDEIAPGDYDKDGMTDIAFFRPSTGYWYILRSSSNFASYYGYKYGTTGDIPLPAEQK
jgi:hypothetical protein